MSGPKINFSFALAAANFTCLELSVVIKSPQGCEVQVDSLRSGGPSDPTAWAAP